MEDREGTSSEEILEDTPRSLNSRIGTPVRFVNHTGRSVKMIWLDYTGNEVFYAKLSGLGTDSLSNGHCFEANTFVTHPWIAVDEETNERMLLNFKMVYFPSEPTIRRVDFQRRRALVVRSEIIITIPGKYSPWNY